jgi:CheY-like chemotaxis protein
MDLALKLALDRRGLRVEKTVLTGLLMGVRTVAPDLVLLVGDATAEGGAEALELLADEPSGAALPVALLGEQRLAGKVEAFRQGIVAVVPKTASADRVAQQIAELTERIQVHEDRTGEIGEATFEELVELVSEELRSGILSVHAPTASGGPLRIVLGEGRPVAEAVREFVQKLQPHVHADTDSMYYQFHSATGGAVELLDGMDEPPRKPASRDLRVLLVDDDPGRADSLAQELRARGAVVTVTDGRGRGLERARDLDPQVALIDSIDGDGFEVVRQLRKDRRLRWASILVANWDEVWPNGLGAPDIEPLLSRVDGVLAPEADLRTRVAGGGAHDVRLEGTGPARLLRVLVGTGATLFVRVIHPQGEVQVDLAEGLVVGARSTGEVTVEGVEALAALLKLTVARVHFEPRDNPTVANVMAPVEDALAAASGELEMVDAAADGPEAPAPREPHPLGPDGAPVLPEGSSEEDTLDDDDPTDVRDLSRLAQLTEQGDQVTVRPPPLDARPEEATPENDAPTASPAPPAGGPMAAGERRAAELQRDRRPKSTLLLGAPELPPSPMEGEPESLEEDAFAFEGFDSNAPAARRGDPARPREGSSGLIPAGALPPVPADVDVAPAEEAHPSPVPEDAPPPGSTAGQGAPPRPEPPTVPAPPSDAEEAPGWTVRTPPPARPEPRVEASGSAPGSRVETPARREEAPSPPRRPRDPGRILAWTSVGLAGAVLLAVVVAIGYRASGVRSEAVEDVLAVLGAAPPPMEHPPPAAPAETPVRSTPPLGEAPEAAAPEAAAPEAPTAEARPPEEPPPEVAAPEVAASQVAAPEEAIAEEAAADAPQGSSEEPPPPEEPAAEAGATAAEGEDPATLRREALGASEAEQEAIYRRILALDPEDYRAAVELAQLLTARGEHAEAAELLTIPVRRRPRTARYRVLYGDALRRAGQPIEARAAWRRALELDPDSRAARLRLGIPPDDR